MFKGTVPVAMTGHRKATAVYCPRCEAWHDTPRGLEPASCPQDLVATVLWYGPLGGAPTIETRIIADLGQAPAFIPRDHLGTVRRGRVRVPFRVEMAD